MKVLFLILIFSCLTFACWSKGKPKVVDFDIQITGVKESYLPSDTMNFNILLMDGQHLYTGWNTMNVIIYDSNSVEKERYTRNRQGAVVMITYKIPSDATVGEWKIKVEVDGKSDEKKFFIIGKPFNAYVEGPNSILFNFPTVDLTLYAKDEGGNYLMGTALVNVRISTESNPEINLYEYNKTVQITEKAQKSVQYHVTNDFGINSVARNMIFDFSVFFTDSVSKFTVKSNSHKMILMPKILYIIEPTHDEFFIPGVNFDIDVKVMHPNRTLVDSTTQKLEMRSWFNNNELNVRIYAEFLKEGAANFVVNNDASVTSIHLKYMFEGVEKTEVITTS